MLGAHLGSELSRRFPDLKRDPAYPGMRRFIEEHCSGDVVKIADHGGDDLYGTRGTATPDGSPQAMPAAPSAWRLFQRADEAGTLAVNSESGDIASQPADAAAPEEPWRIIRRLTVEDHREIARSFIASADEDARAALEAALQTQDYWPAWSRLVNYGFGGKYRQQWAAFRFDQICQKFRESLGAAGIEGATAERALDMLRAEKKRTQPLRRAEPNPASAPFSAASGVFAGLDGNSDLRRIVQAVIGTLSETDLRRLWLPMGEVIDALRKPSR